MKTIAILGSTGSLGTQTLDVLERYKSDFKVVGLLAKQNKNLVEQQGKKWQCEASVSPRFFKADIIVNVVPGLAGIEYTKHSLHQGSTLLLGNKESLVSEGDEIMKIKTGQIIPLDSEHNAIYEILQKYPEKTVEKLILTASGGPFWGMDKAEIDQMTAKQALAHPTWKMGPKVTIESATFINKGFEIVEAHHLFDLPYEQIEVLVHPACQVHSMVKFAGDDHPTAYIAKPDMKLHIENALLRALDRTPQCEIRQIQPNEFEFFEPDHDKFPGINLVLSAPDKKAFMQKEEAAIASFINEKISFLELIYILRGL